MAGCEKTIDKSNVSPDGQVIEQLVESGSDLSKVHPIEFFYMFRVKKIADKVASELKKDGYSPEVKPAAEGETWSVFSTKDIVPTEQTMVEIRIKLEAIASSVGGEYDGWGTPIVK